jgi:hypothetical protein
VDGELRYTVVSADCHGGADIPDHRPYLDPGLRDRMVLRGLQRLPISY